VFLTIRSKSSNPMRAAAINAIPSLEDLNFVKLENALLCVNCELVVGETRSGNCPVCGSGALLGLSRLLGGTLHPPNTEPAVSQPSSVPGKRVGQMHFIGRAG
jgi:hypothetical protein